MDTQEELDSTIYTLRTRTLVDGYIEEQGYEFRRYCDGSKVFTCGECGYSDKLIRLVSQARVLANFNSTPLKCPRCKAAIADEAPGLSQERDE